jgi:Tfp pilus assembly protein PilF
VIGELAPGEYVVNFETTVTDEKGGSILPQASRFQFEVRSAEGADAELAARQAARAFVRGDDATAEQWVRALLKANPQSYVAHSLRGLIAARADDRAAALRHYEQALRILEADADQQFLRVHQASVVGNVRADFRRKVRELR